MKKILGIIFLMLFVAAPVYADIAFVNGDFETGKLDGWMLYSQESNGTTYNSVGTGLTSWSPGTNGGVAVARVAAGNDPIVPIKNYYGGSYSARVGDSLAWGYSGGGNIYNWMTQQATVTGTAPGNLYFAWASVLEISNHGGTATPYFEVKVTNDTKGSTVIYDVKHYEDDAGFWTNANNGWKYSTGNDPNFPGWYVETLDLAALGVSVGDSLTLEALARDCTPSAHAQYVYLDGFGGAPPVKGPEPATLLLLGLGLAGLATLKRKI